MSKRNAGAPITLMLVAMMALASVAQGSDSWEQEFEAKPGQKIELEMKYGGRLVVKGWDKNLVRIICTESVNDFSDYDIEIKEKRSGLRFRATPHKRHRESTGLQVKLMVPWEFDIKTNSGGGGISITDVEGEFRGETKGGAIILRNVTGEAQLSSGGGQIEIVDSELDGHVTTGGGGGVVRNVTGNVKATSDGGVVRYVNVRGDHGGYRAPGQMSSHGITSRTIMHNTDGGAISLDKAPDGAIVETGGGRIVVRNASRLVRAQTGGGDILVDIRDGSVVAQTGAGDIEVRVDNSLGAGSDGLDLRTGHGDVTIVVPADASLEFDIDLAYTRNSSRDFEILSDFDLELVHTKKWRKKSDRSNKWKHIYGTASINGGDHRVVIHGVNGNITIKKQK